MYIHVLKLLMNRYTLIHKPLVPVPCHGKLQQDETEDESTECSL